MTTTNVDETGQYLWIYSNGPYGRSYSKVKIPALDNKNVSLSVVHDAVKRVRITISGVDHGAPLNIKKKNHLHGFKNQGTLAIVDLSTGTEIQKIDLVSLGFKGEPESIAFRGNDLLIGDHGNFYRLYDAAATSINTTTLPNRTTTNIDYNLAGQPVSKDYKGVVICEGKKIVRK